LLDLYQTMFTMKIDKTYYLGSLQRHKPRSEVHPAIYQHVFFPQPLSILNLSTGIVQSKRFKSISPPDPILTPILLSSTVDSAVFGLQSTGINDTFCLVRVEYGPAQLLWSD